MSIKMSEDRLGREDTTSDLEVTHVLRKAQHSLEVLASAVRFEFCVASRLRRSEALATICILDLVRASFLPDHELLERDLRRSIFDFLDLHEVEIALSEVNELLDDLQLRRSNDILLRHDFHSLSQE